MHLVHTPTRAEQAAACAEADTDYAIQQRRADAYRVPPFWPFAPLEPMQAARQQAQQAQRVVRQGGAL